MWKAICLISLLWGATLNTAKGQLTKGNWLVGGSGNFAIQKRKVLDGNTKNTRLQLSPNIGYFFVEKLVAGVKPVWELGASSLPGSSNSSYNLSLGPFLRYYLLPADRPLNVLTETSYRYGWGSGNNRQNMYSISTGPVMYFNTSVGLELTANYEVFNTLNGERSAKTFFLAVV
jgi:hypothetical protein